MKKIYFISLAIILLIGMACKKEKEKSFINTKWKLVGVVDVQSKRQTELEPKDCSKCYTIKFDTDSTFTGRSTSNEMFGYYKIDYTIGGCYFYGQTITEVGEIGGGYRYTDILKKIQSFTIKGKHPRTLHLFYNEGKNYMEYKEMVLDR